MTSQAGMTCFFEQSGTYQICLVAYNNIPGCADTTCKSIIVEENTEIVFVVPNVFTPNIDGNNDNFVVQLIGADLLKELKAEIFNRWGQLVSSSHVDVQSFGEMASSLAMTELVFWDGYTSSAAQAPEGTYFYVISYTTIDGEVKSEKGRLTLLR